MGIRSAVLLALSLATSVADAETLYVQSLKAELLAEPRFGAESVRPLARGQALTALESRGGWYRAEIDGASGWISRLLVAGRPPLAKVTVFTGEEQAIEQDARRRASAVTTAGATRGLAAEDRARRSNDLASDFFALGRVESVVIDEGTVLRFLDEGLEP